MPGAAFPPSPERAGRPPREVRPGVDRAAGAGARAMASTDASWSLWTGRWWCRSRRRLPPAGRGATDSLAIGATCLASGGGLGAPRGEALVLEGARSKGFRRGSRERSPPKKERRSRWGKHHQANERPKSWALPAFCCCRPARIPIRLGGVSPVAVGSPMRLLSTSLIRPPIGGSFPEL
jgi:hypothetical protein